jgi:large subunit ribosomal protein L31
MKAGIHPKYYPNAKVICSCGNTWTTGSTKPEIHTDVCSACHPFYTGEQRIVDTAGQVDRFMRRLRTKDEIRAKVKAEAEARRAQEEAARKARARGEEAVV